MSVLEELSGLEKKVADRLRELRPLVDECAQLERVAERLGIAPDETAAQSALDAPAPARKARGRRRRAVGDANGADAAGATPAANGAQTKDTPAPRTGRSTDDAGSSLGRASTGDAPSEAPKRGAGGGAKSAGRTAGRAVSAPKKRQPGASRAAGRAEQVAALVAERPGITVKDLGAELGVDPTSLYRVVKRLQSDGQLKKDGTGLLPA